MWGGFFSQEVFAAGQMDQKEMNNFYKRKPGRTYSLRSWNAPEVRNINIAIR